MEQRISAIMGRFMTDVYIPNIYWTDSVEVLILAYLIYHLMIWIKNTKAWMLLRGIAVLAIFILVAFIFQMHTILYIAENSVTILATVAVVVFQLELRRALETLGERKFLTSIAPFESGRERARFSEDTMESIIDAAYNMGRVKTGALMVVEQAIHLTEYESTGIHMDCVISMQVLMQIFEHNTPLHDGAVIVRGNRVTSATCYLPLSDNMLLSKELGTRHRAGVGISEVTDSMTVIVSEETGRISVAYEGNLERNLDGDALKERLRDIQGKPEEEKRRKLWKGREKIGN